MNVINKVDGVATIITTDGDGTVTAEDVDITTLNVNAAWTPGFAASAGMTYGMNAFASLLDALKAVGPGTTKITITSDITESVPGVAKYPPPVLPVELSNDLVIGATDGCTVQWDAVAGQPQALMISFRKAEGVEEDVTVTFNNIEWNSTGVSYQTFEFGEYDAETKSGINAVKAVVDATTILNIPSIAVREGSEFEVVDGGKLIVNYEVLNVEGSFKVTGNEEFVVGSAATEDRQAFIKYAKIAGDATITDNYTVVREFAEIRAGGTFTADNAQIEVGKLIDGYSWVLAAVVDNSTLFPLLVCR